jgi:hypothetical protein
MARSNPYTKKFVPFFSTKLPVEKDEKDIPVKGTALLIYQGTLTVLISRIIENGSIKNIYAKNHIFACKTSSQEWRNIAIETTKYVPGSWLDCFLKAMNIKGYLETCVDENEEEAGFDKGFTFSDYVVDTCLKNLRGFSYTAVMELVQNQSGVSKYRVVVSTLKPVLNVNGEHRQRMSASLCRPDVVAIYTTYEKDFT